MIINTYILNGTTIPVYAGALEDESLLGMGPKTEKQCR